MVWLDVMPELGATASANVLRLCEGGWQPRLPFLARNWKTRPGKIEHVFDVWVLFKSNYGDRIWGHFWVPKQEPLLGLKWGPPIIASLGGSVFGPKFGSHFGTQESAKNWVQCMRKSAPGARLLALDRFFETRGPDPWQRTNFLES